MSDHIPQALLIEILARLTVGDLGRCISVCKSWYSLITSPHFVSIHTKQLAAAAATSNSDMLLVRDVIDDALNPTSYRTPYRERYSIHLHNKDHTFVVYKSLDFPFKSYNLQFRIVGCSNGVICLSDNLVAIILWNPSIMKSVTLPSPLVTYDSHGLIDQSIGFGFNSATNDYKVVRVVHVRYDFISPLVEVYDLSVGSWKSVDPKGFCYCINPYYSQIFLDGAVHWVGGSEDDTGFHNMIVSFDLRTDDFGLMKFPDSVADQGFRGDLCITAFGESLALLHHIFSRDFATCSRCNLWVMKQYGVTDSWTKLFSIDLTGGLLNVCGVLKNEEPLVIVDPTEEFYWRNALISYDSKSQQRNFIVEIRDKGSVYVDYFVESLALLGVKGESVEQEESNNKAV